MTVTQATVRSIRAPRGSERTCATWGIEAAYRMIQNNLDPEVAECPEELVVYGGKGKAARSWECFEAILSSLERLNADETLLVQSGKPVGVLPTHENAPRVMICNSNLVPHWATWEHFDELDRCGLMMYGQMTAGSWIYIGTQGILQGTYETLAACGRKYFSAEPLPLSGKTVVTAGLGGMGGAQPLAARLAGAVLLAADVDPERIRRRVTTGYLDEVADSLDDALVRLKEHSRARIPRSIGIAMNAVELLEGLVSLGFVPDVLTDQTSAHDPLHGYIPHGMTFEVARIMRDRDPERYLARSRASIARHVELMLELRRRGAITFDYGNNIRAVAQEEGVADAFDIHGFVPEFIRPQFCDGAGPFRWVALSGDPADIAVTDHEMLQLFPDNAVLQNWLRNGARCVKFQGLPARICWLRLGERTQAGLLFNRLVREGKVQAPIAIGRDHLDCGSVASPNRETERMLDGSDAVSDWVFLNALVNAVNGADWVSVHHGGGVGIGFSQHAGMVVVADGTLQAEERLSRVLHSDPALGVFRHADAGYRAAINTAKSHRLNIPMIPRAID